MARLLPQEEHEDLLADRERLEWVMGQYSVRYYPPRKMDDSAVLIWRNTATAKRQMVYTLSMRSAIDRARGAK